MRTAGILFLLVAIGLGAFAWWGLGTSAGQEQFEESDGMYPFFAMLVACFFTLVGICLIFLGVQRSRESSK